MRRTVPWALIVGKRLSATWIVQCAHRAPDPEYVDHPIGPLHLAYYSCSNRAFETTSPRWIDEEAIQCEKGFRVSRVGPGEVLNAFFFTFIELFPNDLPWLDEWGEQATTWRAAVQLEMLCDDYTHRPMVLVQVQVWPSCAREQRNKEVSTSFMNSSTWLWGYSSSCRSSALHWGRCDYGLDVYILYQARNDSIIVPDTGGSLFLSNGMRTENATDKTLLEKEMRLSKNVKTHRGRGRQWADWS
ncbi:hypothetical protein Tco_0429222 [Tanacetum coccineum]